MGFFSSVLHHIITSTKFPGPRCEPQALNYIYNLHIELKLAEKE